MNRKNAIVAGLLLTGCGLAAAQDSRTELQRTALSGAQGMEVIASTTEYLPGDTLSLHLHHGVEVAYVLQGAMVQSPADQQARALPAGASLLNKRNIVHGGFTIVGDTALKVLTVHVVDIGRPLYDESTVVNQE